MDDFKLSPICIQIFSLQCIETATCKYKTMIGEGGFGAVYRGTLLHGQEVAVKVRSATSTQGTREFENEVNLSCIVLNLFKTVSAEVAFSVLMVISRLQSVLSLNYRII